ncbi:MAG: class I SAM-dependent methyltransferase [Gammaproteobacteria bacterium]
MSNDNRKDTLSAAPHFAFGKNWANYAEMIGESQVTGAVRGLTRLLGGGRLDGKRFLDIGSGSGLHSLAALKLGAAEVLAVDIDVDSIATTKAVLARYAPGANYTVREADVFDMDATHEGGFDVVYSWGVLHHTGDLHRALRCAANLTRPGGQFLFAVYRKTLLCSVWRLEKHWYADAGPGTQKALRVIYLGLFRMGLWTTGRRFHTYVAAYRARGMDFHHDVHDWLGGYPYESMLPAEVAKLMNELGLMPVRAFVRETHFSRRFGRHPGLLGSGCDEYVYARPAAAQSDISACVE